MNRFVLQGFINTIKFQPECVLIMVDEYRKGYTKTNGEKVDDKYLSWKVIFKPALRQYISKFFNRGMLVDIDAEMYPYAIEHGKQVDGYSCLGLCINVASYPRASVKQELKMIKDSQEASTEQPNLDDFKQEDF